MDNETYHDLDGDGIMEPIDHTKTAGYFKHKPLKYVESGGFAPKNTA